MYPRRAQFNNLHPKSDITRYFTHYLNVELILLNLKLFNSIFSVITTWSVLKRLYIY